MQLSGALSGLLCALVLCCVSVSTADADGTMTMRGAYYKERSTRVMQPMLDGDLGVGEDGAMRVHLLLDAITSASAAAGAAGEPFTETRTEGGAAYLHSFGDLRFGGGVRHSSEPDYRSSFVSLRLERDFAMRNTTLGLNLARGLDRLNNSGSQGGLSSVLSGKLDTTMVSLSASQLLSPVSAVSLTYDMSYLQGFQENIYRTVIAGGMIEPERVPETRMRHALATTLRYYLQPTNTTLIGAYRFYRDDWNIQAHAPELRVVQELLGGDMELHLSYRFYRQRAADFFKEVYNTNDMSVEPYMTDDSKLGHVRSHNAGIKLSVTLGRLGIPGSWGNTRIEGLFQYLKQNTHYGDAVISQLALTFPLEY